MVEPSSFRSLSSAASGCGDDDDPSSPTKNNDNNNKYTEAFFQQWLDANKSKITSKLPKLDVSHCQFFTAACQNVQDKNRAKDAAIKTRDDIAKQKPIDQEALDKANQAVKEATDALETAQTHAYEQSLPLLDFLEPPPQTDEDRPQQQQRPPFDKDTIHLLLVTNVLIHATPKGLANYCQNQAVTDNQATAVVQLLQDPKQFPLLQEMVLAGGAKKGQYGPALEIYTQLQAHIGSTTDNKKPPLLLERLALAVALELADPILEFGQDPKDPNKKYIDPIHRYIHYEQAWMFGELDPVFETAFGVWELRMVVNSLAPDDQLGWGRQMLMNYRPDLMTLQDKWRYCRIVRTDVFYTGKPYWPTKPLDFPQILSGGGECGPRAWMGRFICRAFGIPVWGVKEPGHAAMSRWTADEGWVVCLGADMPVAWWDDESGLFFQLEAAARKVCASSSTDVSVPNYVYGDKVMMLDWVADLLAEPQEQVVKHFLEDPAALWRSLALMKRKRLTQKSTTTTTTASSSSSTSIGGSATSDVGCRLVVPQMERLQIRNAGTTPEKIVTLDTGTIIVPASDCEPFKQSDDAIIMDSFLGGKQLFLNKDAQVEYILTSAPGGKYQLTCKFVSVHDDIVQPAPLLVTVDDGEGNSAKVGDTITSDWEMLHDNPCSVYTVPLPYTKGMWQETEAVMIELPTTVQSCKISLTREATAHGIALKNLKLVPVKA